MNLTLHASGSVQIGEGQPLTTRNLSVQVEMLPPEDGSAVGIVLLTITDSMDPAFTLKMKLTSLQAAQLGYQLCDLAQDANHIGNGENPVVILPPPPTPTPDALKDISPPPSTAVSS